MESNQIFYSPLPSNESGDHVLSKNYWILQTELMQISKVVGLPHATYAQIEEIEEAPNSNKQMIRKSIQGIIL